MGQSTRTPNWWKFFTKPWQKCTGTDKSVQKVSPFSRSYTNEFPRNQLQVCFCREPRVTHVCQVASDAPEATDGDGDGVLLISGSLASR